MRDKIVKPYFSKEESLILKGIAILLMLFHHFFTFPDWWVDGIKYPLLEKIGPYLSYPTKICVPIFCFITGYSYFYNKNKTYRYSAKKISNIMIYYWVVLLIFGLIAHFAAGYQYDWIGILKEIFVIKRDTLCFTWYVAFYYCIMLIIPIAAYLFGRNILIDAVLCLLPYFLLPVLLRFSVFEKIETVSGIISYSPAVWIGYICARYNIFGNIEDRIDRWIPNRYVKTICYYAMIGLVFLARWKKPNFIIRNFFEGNPVYICMDLIYVPIVIFALVNISRTIKKVVFKNIIGSLGRYSLLMWLVHCLFFNNSKIVFQRFLYISDNIAIVYFWGILVCYCMARVLDKLVSGLLRQIKFAGVNEN